MQKRIGCYFTIGDCMSISEDFGSTHWLRYIYEYNNVDESVREVNNA